MFISKINGANQKTTFKSIHTKINDVGEDVKRFNYLYDYKDGNEKCEIQIFKVKRLEDFNYKIDTSNPAKVAELKPEGITLELLRDANIGKDEAFAYKIVRKDKNGNTIWEGADTGVKMKEISDGIYGFRTADGKASDSDYTDPIRNYQYTLVTQHGTTPMIQGAGVLMMPDTFIPGARYKDFNEDGTGEVVYDSEHQRKMEGMVKTITNMYGGSLAGVEMAIPELHKYGIKKIPTTPIGNGDNRTSHGYYNKMNKQVQSNLGTSENFDSLMKTAFRYGMNPMYDATLTSHGIESVYVRNALRYGEQSQFYRMFQMSGLKNNGISFGILPNEMENIRFRVINPINNHEKQANGTYKSDTNYDYKPNRETLIQIYDASQVSDEQLSKLDEEIDMYQELTAGKNLNITTYDDTAISYVFEVNPNEYEKNINNVNELVKSGKKIDLQSAEGALAALNFSNFRISKTSEGYVAWDDNPDMLKVNYGISAYDEKDLQSIVDRAERQHEQDLRIRASKEATDLAVQTLMYWADKAKTAQTVYALQTIGNAKSAEKIQKLIDDGLLPKLPEGNEMTQKVIDNILNGEYKLEPKGILDRDDATVKGLMKFHLDSLEVGENTVGVLATSYFSNLATTDETIGMSRFDLLKQNNPHLVNTYANVYSKVNELFTNDLKDLADSVIKKVNETSDVPLITSNTEYTEYGEYVIDIFGRNIAKYALLKSLAGDSFAYKILPDGTITYDYKNIKNATTLKALGINANNPAEEAEMLYKRIKKGLNKLDNNDIDALAKSITTVIKGKDTSSFRLAEAFLDRSGYGLDFRFDAAKDVKDMDSIRNRDADFDDTWLKLITMYNKCMQGIKSVNRHTYAIVEATDVPEVMRDTFGGPDSCPYNGWTNFNGVKFNGEPDAMTKFLNETGVTSEAAYSYLFTELLINFSREFEKGERICDTHDEFKHKYDLLINTRSADYIRNNYTFIGNHDKTRTIHGLAVDMSLFQSTLSYFGADFGKNHQQRAEVIRVLSGAHTMEEVPLELRLNVDNLDYFRTVSARAVAQTKLLMDSVDNDLNGIASKEDIKLIREALIDLANGNYMTSKTSEKMTRINIPEISSIEGAVKEVVKFANQNGANIDNAYIESLISNVNKLNIDDYAIRGDFDWSEEHQEIGDRNKGYLKEILGTDDNAADYSLYTVQIARMIKEAAKNTNQASSINNALKTFVSVYNREKINQNTDSLKMYEDFKTSRKKNSYAAQDFRVALEEAFNQAEYKSGKKINNKEKITEIVFNSITEPAIKKQAMMLSFLSGLCGMPTIFAGDEYGDTGYEDKSKNPNVRNRMASRRSEIDRNTGMGKIMNRNKEVTYDALKHKAMIKPLQNGTPYTMDIMAEGRNRDEISARINEINQICNDSNTSPKLKQELEKERELLKNHKAKVAYITQSDDGDAAISVFNAAGISHENRFNYFEKYGIQDKNDRIKFFQDNNIESINIDNPYIPIQEKTTMDAILMGAGVTLPLGTLFMNADTRDKAKYVVEKINDRIGIVRKEGNKTAKIVLDGITAKNGVMILRKVKNIAFRGGAGICNQQYNFVSNPYTKAENIETGEKLSVIAK